jgi:hypothetical protein
MQMNPPNSEGRGPVERPNGDAERRAAQLAELAEGPELRDILSKRARLLSDRPGLVDRLEAASRGSLEPRVLRFPSERTRSWGRVVAALAAAAIGITLFVWPQSQQQPRPAGKASELTEVVAGGGSVSLGTPSEPILVSLLADSDVVDAVRVGARDGADPIALLRARDTSYRKISQEVAVIALATREAR